jgi:AraC family transcriptional regulator
MAWRRQPETLKWVKVELRALVLKLSIRKDLTQKTKYQVRNTHPLGWAWSTPLAGGLSQKVVIMLKRLSGGESLGKVIRCQSLAGLILTETRHAPGSHQPRHCHENAYFCLPRRGSYREEFGGLRRTCTPLMLAFHPRGEVHAEQVDGEEVQSFNLEMTPSWLSSVTTAPLGQPFDCRGGPLLGLAIRLLDEFEHADASSALIVEGLTLELLGLCIREARSGRAAPRWLQQVRDLLNEHCTAAYTLAGLAAEAGVHPGYLAGAFRRHFGCTVGAYIRRRRVALACRELADSDVPLAEVAVRAGFADQSHFTRVFKCQIGLTPAAYRKMADRAAGRAKR